MPKHGQAIEYYLSAIPILCFSFAASERILNLSATASLRRANSSVERELSSGITTAIAALGLLCAAILLFDLARGQRWRAGVGLCLLILFAVSLHLMTGFPRSSSRLAFGGSIPGWWAVVAMAIGVVFGMIAQYVWSKPKQPRFMDFLRPIVVSPLVLLPLIGSLQDGPLETLQLASLALLAFQNGFFWQQVLKEAKPAQP